MVWLTYLYLGVIITENYQRMYDSDYNALKNFSRKNELTPQFIRTEITAIWKKFHAKLDKNVENIILHASIKILENLDISYLRWSKVAACNFVKTGLNHKCFLFPKVLLNRTPTDLRNGMDRRFSTISSNIKSKLCQKILRTNWVDLSKETKRDSTRRRKRFSTIFLKDNAAKKQKQKSL